MASIGERVSLRRVTTVLTTPRSFLYLALWLGLALAIVYPVAVIVAASFASGQPAAWGHFTTGAYTRIFHGQLGEVAKNSFIYAFGRVGISLPLALLFAWAVARTNVVGRRWIAALVPIPFFIPDLVTGISWVYLGNPQNGLLNQFLDKLPGVDGNPINVFGWGGLLFHSSFSATAFIYILMLGFFYNMDPAFEEASLTSGAGTYKTLFRVTLPLLVPAILGTALLSFISALESFESPLLFGGPAHIEVFSSEIYRVLRNVYPFQYNSASAISVILVLVTLPLILAQRMWVGRRQYVTVSGKGFRPKRLELRGFARWGIFALFVVYILAALVIPLAVVIAGSFFETTGIWDLHQLTLDNWRTVLTDRAAMDGLRNTITYSFLAAIVVILVGGLIGHIRVRVASRMGKTFEVVAWLPWMLPGITLGLAFLWASLLVPKPFVLYGTAAIIVIGFVVKGLPLGTRQMQSSIMQIGPELEECSRVMGASWSRSISTITVPLLRAGAAAAFVVVFTLSARDLTVPLLLYSRGKETLSVTLLFYYEKGGQDLTAVVSVIQLCVIVVLLILERLTRPKQAWARVGD